MKVWVRPARREDQQKFKEYITNTPQNMWDQEVLNYPTTRIFVAHDNGEPVVFLPIQQAVVLESLAIDPKLPEETKKRKVAMALKALVSNVSLQTAQAGMGEIYFLCKEESTIEFAKGNGFTELPWKTFRLKLSDLEKPNETKDIPNNSNRQSN